MAELSTIARPYAVGLMEALQERKASAQDMSAVLDAVSRLAETAVDPQIGQLEGDPGLTDDQFYDIFASVVGADQPDEVKNLLRVVIQNGRVDALPEIARQFRILKNESEGVADALIETAFPLSDAELKDPRSEASPGRFSRESFDWRRACARWRQAPRCLDPRASQSDEDGAYRIKFGAVRCNSIPVKSANC